MHRVRDMFTIGGLFATLAVCAVALAIGFGFAQMNGRELSARRLGALAKGGETLLTQYEAAEKAANLVGADMGEVECLSVSPLYSFRVTVGERVYYIDITKDGEPFRLEARS